jgi:hypothetical protein
LKLSCLLILACFFVVPVTAQTPDMQRDFMIPAGMPVQQLDSLSIMSFSIFGPDSLPLDPAFYEIDFISARLFLRIPEFWREDSLRVTYKVWPVNFAAPVFLRDTSLMRPPGPGEDPMVITLRPTIPEQGLLRFEGLQSSGSITRGLTMGNRQDVTLRSAMNLQLSGMLTENIEILAVISDQNIPFQPEGTTQQIQDFDKVFIKLSGMGASLVAGDFELEKPPGYFMNFNRKARGASISYESQKGDTTLLGRGQIRTTVAGAISRGKYARNLIPGVEGNQGPYRLTGNDSESFIMVMAGTERVYIDGVLMTRGMENDYVIDYNMAEVTFTPSRMITRDSRIVVEFEYAERNFARSMVFSGTELLYDRARFRLNFLSEQDHRNQSLFQELSDERKAMMASVGDSIHRAFDWNLDSTGFKNDRVMYRLTDTLGFDTVFVFSTEPQVAVYQLGFTLVGQGNGNYRQVSSAANGRVFQWVAPQNGVPQGTHEPIILLVTPKSHQMLTLGGEVDISRYTVFDFEYGLSNRDINLFSDLHKDNNLGHAIRMGITDTRGDVTFEGNRWKYITHASWETTGQNFIPLERYRGVEFERDWNLQDLRATDVEHLPEFSFTAQHRQWGQARYRFSAFLKGDEYTGIRNSMDNRIQIGKNRLEYYGSLLNTTGFRESVFYRHRASLAREMRNFTTGVNHHTENNRIQLTEGNGLSDRSASFDEWEFFVTNPVRAINSYRIFYKYREDKLPIGQDFGNASFASDYGVQYQFLKNPNQRVGLQTVYRELDVQRERIPGEQSNNTINGRIDYFSRWANGAITSNLFYEAASGLEQKREYFYVEVPAGQGAYIWNDYNKNGIMELDEFEIAPFPDEANFIRVFIPTREFVSTYANSFSQSLNIDPMIIWRQGEGLQKFLSRFSNRFNYRVDNKRMGGIELENFNPFAGNIDDISLITHRSSLRNSLAFNRTHPVYSIEWIVQDNRNKNLLSNGFESRFVDLQSLRGRWNISRVYSIVMMASQGASETRSEFFAQRNFRIINRELEPTFSYQPGSNLRVSFFYAWQEKGNNLGDTRETAIVNRAGAETRYSMPARGNLQARYELSLIEFPFPENTPVAFEILQGLRPGTNHVWNINWQQNLSSYLQLSLNYNGRKPPGISAIHTGTVQVRALF